MVDVNTLAARIRRINPRWQLRVIDGEIELTGNGAPAAWRKAEDCAAWLKKIEKGNAR